MNVILIQNNSFKFEFNFWFSVDKKTLIIKQHKLLLFDQNDYGLLIADSTGRTKLSHSYVIEADLITKINYGFKW